MAVQNNAVKLKVNHIHKTYDGKVILGDISFEVMDGEFLAVLGLSGCGKTTLLRILIGLERQDSGQYTGEGKRSLRWRRINGEWASYFRIMRCFPI